MNNNFVAQDIVDIVAEYVNEKGKTFSKDDVVDYVIKCVNLKCDCEDRKRIEFYVTKSLKSLCNTGVIEYLGGEFVVNKHFSKNETIYSFPEPKDIKMTNWLKVYKQLKKEKSKDVEL